MNPMALTYLMQEAEKGNPAAKQALSTAGREEFDKTIEPPPTQGQIPQSNETINVTAPMPPPAQGLPVAPASLPPAPAALPQAQPVAGTDQAPTYQANASTASTPTSGLTGMSPGQPTGGGEKAGWKKDLALIGGGLAGAGLARLFGGKGAAGQFMTGYSEPVIGNIQARQAQEMKRAQTVWADQWEQAKTLPPELINGPDAIPELAQAYQAMQKDMEAGNVNNPKTAAAFMMAHAKFRKEIEDANQKLAIGREIEKSNLLADAQHQNNLKRVKEAMETLNAPPGTVPEEAKQAAAAFLRDVKAPQPREVVDPATNQKVTKFLTDEEYNGWNFKIKDLEQRQQELTQRKIEADSLAAYRRDSVAIDRTRAENESKRYEEAENQRNSRRTGIAAVNQLNAAVNNRLSAMANDPAMAQVPLEQRKSIALQKVLGDSVTQRDLLRASGAQMGKDEQGRPAIQINGQTIPFDPRNPQGNMRAMEIILGQIQSNSRLGEME